MTIATDETTRRRASRLGLGRYRASAAEKPWLTRGALLYTTCDEDADSERAALQSGHGDVVVSITGSGCRSLGLLADPVGRVVSVDANPLQNHLLELKAAGIAAHERDDLLEMIGVRPASADRRRELYRAARPRMSEEARSFWDANAHVIGDGVIFSGAHETFYRRFIGPLIRWLRPRRLRQLYAFDDVAQQARFYDRHWNHLGWRVAVRLLAQSWSVRLLLGDPSYFAHVNRAEGFAGYLLERLRTVFSHRLARENDVFTMYVHGRYLHDDAVPTYLRPGDYERVRANIDRLEVVTAPVDTYLASLPPRSVDHVSLSDVTGWMPKDAFERVVGDAARVCRPRGRVVYRCFLTDRPWPDGIGGRSLADLADRLARTDRAFAFTFVVAEILPDEKGDS